MKNQLIGLFLMLLLISCGARKVNKSDSSISEHTEQNVKTDVVTIENSKDSTITETVEISPCDAAKPAYLNENGKISNISNAYFKKTRIIKISSNKKVLDKVSESELNKKETSKLEVKQIDQQAWSAWNLLWFLIPLIILIMLYFILRKSNPIDQAETIIEEIINKV